MNTVRNHINKFICWSSKSWKLKKWCDTVSGTMVSFPHWDATRIKSEQFSAFGSRTNLECRSNRSQQSKYNSYDWLKVATSQARCQGKHCVNVAPLNFCIHKHERTYLKGVYRADSRLTRPIQRSAPWSSLRLTNDPRYKQNVLTVVEEIIF